MSAWVLIPCLKALFAEFDRIAPARDKASDGSIGDLAHQQEVSDHNPDETGSVPIHDADKINEVHAIDVDNDLNESDLTMEKVVQFLLGRCRSGAEKRLRYMIYNRRIWSASSGWVEKKYTGPSPHTEHAHFSASYESAREADTSSWHLEEIPVALTAADKSWIESTVKAAAADDAALAAAVAKILAAVADAGDDFLTVKIGDLANPGRTVGDVLRDVAKLRGVLIGDAKDAANAKLSPSSPLAHIIAAAGDIEEILAAVKPAS